MYKNNIICKLYTRKYEKINSLKSTLRILVFREKTEAIHALL